MKPLLTYRWLIVLVLLFVISLNKSVAQGTANVSGTVKSSVTGEPQEGASVVLINSAGQAVFTQITDTAGFFRFTGVAAGNFFLEVAMGKSVKFEQLTLSQGQELRLEIALDPLTLPTTILQNTESKTLPGAVTEIDTRQLEMIRPIGTQELAAYIPGVYAAADDGMGNSRVSIGIRGLSPRRSARVLVLEDGIPIEPALYVYPNMYYNPPVERLDKIEVLKGSAAIKYGPQTMGGVINYITSRPRTKPGGVTQLMLGNHGFFSLYNETGGFGKGKLKPEVQLLYKRGDGFRENNTFHQLNGTFKGNVIFNDKQTLYIKANANYENSQATYTGLTEYSFATNPRFNPKENDQFTVFRVSLDLIYTNEISKDLTSKTLAYANMFDRSWWRENDIFVRADNPDVTVGHTYRDPIIRTGNGRNNFGNLRTFYVAGVERHYTYDHKLFKRKSTLEAGGRFYWDRFLDNKKIGLSPDAREGVYIDSVTYPTLDVYGVSQNWETSAFSFYALENFNLTEKFLLVPGFRVEVFEQEMIDRLQGSKYFDNSSAIFLPGFGFNYELSRATNLFGGIHRGYTPPSSGTLAVVSFGAASTGIDVKSEKSWNKELGLRYRTAKWGSAEVTAFHLGIQDVIGFGRGGTLKNFGTAQTYGLENLIQIRTSNISAWMPDVFINYTWLQTRLGEAYINSAYLKTQMGTDSVVNIEGNRLPYAPEHTLTFGLRKKWEKLVIWTDINYFSQVYTDYENIEFTRNRGDTGPIDAYYLWNATVEYSVSKRWKTFITAKNILDRVYIGSRLHSDPYEKAGSNYLSTKANLSSGIMPGNRRQVNLGLRYEF